MKPTAPKPTPAPNRALVFATCFGIFLPFFSVGSPKAWSMERSVFSQEVNEDSDLPFQGNVRLQCASDGLKQRTLEVALETEVGKGVVKDTTREGSESTPLLCERLHSPDGERNTLFDFGKCAPEKPSFVPVQYVLQWGGFAQSFSVTRFRETKPTEFFSCIETSGSLGGSSE